MTTDFMHMDALPEERLLSRIPVASTVTTAAGWAAALMPPCRKYGINTKARLACFLAHTLHETGGFNRLTENLNYRVDALLSVFGRHRISDADARRLGRKPGEPPLSIERQSAIANLIYGGEWGRRNLGNVEPGDGWRFRGHGLMQLTGRANMTRFASMIGTTPDDAFLAKLRTPEGAADSAAHFFAVSGCNKLADDGKLRETRRIINGGFNGMDDVEARYNRLLTQIDEVFLS